MSTIVINSKKCLKDGICALVCSSGVFNYNNKQIPSENIENATKCIKCGQCIAFCPVNAVEVAGLEKDQIKKIDYHKVPKEEELAILIESRRSIRNYKGDIVPKEIINSLISLSSYAPSACNSRELRYVVLYERKKLLELGEKIIQNFLNYVEKKPEKDGFLSLINAWKNGVDVIFRGAPHLILAVMPQENKMASTDAACVLTYLEIAAWGRGIGSCWAGFVMIAANMFSEVRTLLGLSDKEILAGGLMLGYPLIKPTFTAPRDTYPIEYRN